MVLQHLVTVGDEAHQPDDGLTTFLPYLKALFECRRCDALRQGLLDAGALLGRDALPETIENATGAVPEPYRLCGTRCGRSFVGSGVVPTFVGPEDRNEALPRLAVNADTLDKPSRVPGLTPALAST